MPAMEKAGKELEERGISYEMRVMSAHRDPDVVADYAKNAQHARPARDHRRRRAWRPRCPAWWRRTPTCR